MILCLGQLVSALNLPVETQTELENKITDDIISGEAVSVVDDVTESVFDAIAESTVPDTLLKRENTKNDTKSNLSISTSTEIPVTSVTNPVTSVTNDDQKSGKDVEEVTTSTVSPKDLTSTESIVVHSQSSSTTENVIEITERMHTLDEITPGTVESSSVSHMTLPDDDDYLTSNNQLFETVDDTNIISARSTTEKNPDSRDFVDDDLIKANDNTLPQNVLHKSDVDNIFKNEADSEKSYTNTKTEAVNDQLENAIKYQNPSAGYISPGPKTPLEERLQKTPSVDYVPIGSDVHSSDDYENYMKTRYREDDQIYRPADVNIYQSSENMATQNENEYVRYPFQPNYVQNGICTMNEFECVSDHQCIPQSWVCDTLRRWDCHDGSDEDPKICPGRGELIRCFDFLRI